MSRSGRWNGVVVAGLGLGGLAVALSSRHRSAPLWPVWAVLAVSLSGAAGLVAVYGLASWHGLSRTRPLPWRATILPTAGIVAGVPLTLVAGELLAASPGSGWRGDVLVMLTVAGGACAGLAMFGLRAVVLALPVATGDVAALEDAVVEAIALRRLLQRLASALGWLVALSTLALGAGISLSDNAPRELVVVFGGAGSAMVATFYAPAAVAMRVHGERLVAAIFAERTPDDATELVDRVEKRMKLESLIGVDRTLFGDLQAAIPVLGPLVVAAAVFLPK
ncbi:MAG: hypothetical protein HOV83_12475 [Catenulispora sp.]|nr:hypothetical protein [Catenulispora sp.]